MLRILLMQSIEQGVEIVSSSTLPFGRLFIVIVYLINPTDKMGFAILQVALLLKGQWCNLDGFLISIYPFLGQWFMVSIITSVSCSYNFLCVVLTSLLIYYYYYCYRGIYVSSASVIILSTIESRIIAPPLPLILNFSIFFPPRTSLSNHPYY